MAAESTQTSNLPWQARQLGRNVSEWIQLRLSRADDNSGNESTIPSIEWPEWLGSSIAWLIVTAGILWIAWMIVRSLETYAARRKLLQRRPQIQTLRPTPEQSAAEWVKQAQLFEQQGNWVEACRALYRAALQLLHDRKWVPHRYSRTDGEYLQEIQQLKQPRPLQLLIRTHERSHFGAEPLTAENWQHCRQAYKEIEKR